MKFTLAGFLSFLLLSSFSYAATVPVVHVLSPALVHSPNSSQFTGISSIHYVAYSDSTDCAAGIASMQIYTSGGNLAYSTHSSYLDVQLPLAPGTYPSVVKAWDNCGGVSAATITDTVQSSSGSITVRQPISNVTYSPSVLFAATATTTCPTGVAAMGVYDAPHHRAVTQKGAKLDWGGDFYPGVYNAVIEEWDNCGGAASVTVRLVVDPKGMPDSPPYVYAADSLSGTVLDYWLDTPSCGLREIFGNPSPAHYKPIGVGVDPVSQFVVVLNSTSEDLSIYAIDRQVTGGLTQIPGSPFPLNGARGYVPTSIAVADGGSLLYVYVTNTNIDAAKGGNILEFTLDRTTQQLSPVAGSPYYLHSKVQPTEIIIGPQSALAGRFIFTANGDSISSLTGAAGAGDLSEATNSPFPVKGHFGNDPSVQDMVVADFGSDGRYLYSGNLEGSISAFRVDDYGVLSPVPGTPFVPPLENGNTQNPFSLAVLGNWLYTMNSGTDDIGLWSINTNTGHIAFARNEQQGRVLTNPQNRIRILSSYPDNCMVTSNGYSMSISYPSGTTTLAPGSPFWAGGIYPSVDLVLP
ncbi:MAG TPA: hypothetical protein VH437_14410 [Terriglobales bacterium]|jgi:hypothetical protein